MARIQAVSIVKLVLLLSRLSVVRIQSNVPTSYNSFWFISVNKQVKISVQILPVNVLLFA